MGSSEHIDQVVTGQPQRFTQDLEIVKTLCNHYGQALVGDTYPGTPPDPTDLGLFAEFETAAKLLGYPEWPAPWRILIMTRSRGIKLGDVTRKEIEDLSDLAPIEQAEVVATLASHSDPAFWINGSSTSESRAIAETIDLVFSDDQKTLLKLIANDSEVEGILRLHIELEPISTSTDKNNQGETIADLIKKMIAQAHELR